MVGVGSRFFVADRNVSSVAPTMPPAVALMSAENCTKHDPTTKRGPESAMYEMER